MNLGYPDWAILPEHLRLFAQFIAWCTFGAEVGFIVGRLYNFL